MDYFDTDGSASFPHEFEKPDILDAAWDNINDVFYTIRFNDQNVGTVTIALSDDFSGGEAGTASGTTNFHPGRWTESSTNTSFLRTGDKLSYNVATGKGQLETNYTMVDFNAAIDFDPVSVTVPESWFALRALDSDNKTLIQEGIGFDQVPGTSGVIFGSSFENFVDSAGDSTFRDFRPLWHNTASGTDSFVVAFGGSTWSVSGSLTGLLTEAQTGVNYGESTDSNTPVEFLISSTATPSAGEQFSFDLITENVKNGVTATGVLSMARSVGSFTTGIVFTTPKAISSDPVTVELYGNAEASTNISLDNFEVSPDPSAGTFATVSVFTIERTDADGDLTGSPTVIDSFDVIGDPGKTYR